VLCLTIASSSGIVFGLFALAYILWSFSANRSTKPDLQAAKGNVRTFSTKSLSPGDTKGANMYFGIGDLSREAAHALFAGADTKAMAFRSVIHNLLKTPRALSRLTDEIDAPTR